MGSTLTGLGGDVRGTVWEEQWEIVKGLPAAVKAPLKHDTVNLRWAWVCLFLQGGAWQEQKKAEMAKETHIWN